MTTIVIGGHSRNVGKTSLVEAIIASWPRHSWTAVKISSHWHDHKTKAGLGAGEEIFRIDEEFCEKTATDTGRYLTAGAERSFWVRVRTGHLQDAIPALMPVLNSSPYVIIESNGIVKHITPDLYLMVLRFDVGDCKKSTLETIQNAHAIIAVNYGKFTPSWIKSFPDAVSDIPIFQVPDPSRLSGDLREFIRLRL
jgi:hypothetical protein